MQDYLYEHFYSDEHNGFLVAITLIDKTDDKSPKQGNLMDENLSPDGRNIEDCV